MLFFDDISRCQRSEASALSIHQPPLWLDHYIIGNKQPFKVANPLPKHFDFLPLEQEQVIHG